jgi:hypothetical protein
MRDERHARDEERHARDEGQLKTADIARASDDMRGRQEEAIRNRPDLLEQPPAASAAPEPQPARSQPASPRTDERSPLFVDRDSAELRKRWSDIQAGFVDEPRRAVEQADSLVADVMKRLAEGFANERGALERQWDRGDNVTTEDLRVALRRYRSFFDRLLSL